MLGDWFGRIEISLEETFKLCGHFIFNPNIPWVPLTCFYHCLRADIKYNTKVYKETYYTY